MTDSCYINCACTTTSCTSPLLLPSPPPINSMAVPWSMGRLITFGTYGTAGPGLPSLQGSDGLNQIVLSVRFTLAFPVLSLRSKLDGTSYGGYQLFNTANNSMLDYMVFLDGCEQQRLLHTLRGHCMARWPGVSLSWAALPHQQSLRVWLQARKSGCSRGMAG